MFQGQCWHFLHFPTKRFSSGSIWADFSTKITSLQITNFNALPAKTQRSFELRFVALWMSWCPLSDGTASIHVIRAAPGPGWQENPAVTQAEIIYPQADIISEIKLFEDHQTVLSDRIGRSFKSRLPKLQA